MLEHFKSKEAERKNLAYRHMHGIPYTATTAVVAGKSHKVQHSTTGPRVKIDAKQRKKNALGDAMSKSGLAKRK